MSNNLLPSQPICYSGLERVSLSVSQLLRRFSDDRQKGSVTAEAAVAVPVFFLAVVTMLYLLEMMAVHTAVRSGLQYAGKKATKESCVTQIFSSPQYSALSQVVSLVLYQFPLSH